jgi:hypothetical protein
MILLGLAVPFCGGACRFFDGFFRDRQIFAARCTVSRFHLRPISLTDADAGIISFERKSRHDHPALFWLYLLPRYLPATLAEMKLAVDQ